MPVRMKDIARDLNVSVVTVSKVLRNDGDIGPLTRKRVLQRMKELNYQPNWVARSLATRRTYIIGLVVPDLMHSFFAEVAKGVERKIRPRGYHVLISNSDEDAQSESREIEFLLARQVDGLILASAQPRPTEVLSRVAELRVPYVLIDRMPPDVRANYVGVDDEEVGMMATEHLIERGCRRIGHIRGPQISTGVGRLKGYRRALARHGLQAPAGYIVQGKHGDKTGYEAMRALLQTEPRPDGVFCYNDPVAAGAMQAILDAGFRVPQDIAVVGAGNVHYSSLLRVPLSTVDQSSSSIGEHAAKLLLGLIESKRVKAPRKILLRPKLVVRESTGGSG